MSQTIIKISHMCFRGGAEASKPQTSTQKATGAAKRSETIVKSAICASGGRGSLKAGSFHSKSRGSSQMVRNRCKNPPYGLLGLLETVPGLAAQCRAVLQKRDSKKNPDPFLRSILATKNCRILFETQASTRSRGQLLKKPGAPERAV